MTRFVEFAADAYEREIAGFRAAREAKYRSADGWLTLVDRILLEPGENHTPVGIITVDADTKVTLDIPVDLAVTRGGQPISGRVSIAMPGIGNTAPPVVFVLSGLRYEVVRRSNGHLRLRVRDPQAPARLAFQSIPVYPIDPSYRVSAEFSRLPAPEVMSVETSDGEDDLAHLLGEAHFTLPGEGGPQRLQIFLEQSTSRLYVPFGDRTNRTETYGGGRFLYGVEDGRSLVLDFNRACNPPCAFNPLVTCPLPPPANRLDVPVRAGERLPRGN